MLRQILIYGDYFYEFYYQQDLRTREKIDYILDLIRNIDQVPAKFLKYIEGTDGLYEIRIITVNKNIRIICFFDEERIIVLTNCFIKKTQKLPRNVIDSGNRLKREYFENKKRNIT